MTNESTERLKRIREQILEGHTRDVIEMVIYEDQLGLKALIGDLLHLDEMSETELIEYHESLIDQADLEDYNQEWEEHNG